MNSGLFGPRGPSYPYYTNRYSNSYENPYLSQYTNQPTYSYPNGYLTPSYTPYPSHNPYYGQFQSSLHGLTSYSLGNPGILIPSKGLETILVAILVLVVLDNVFIRPLKGAK